MPIYTYHCENCGHQFDKRQSFNESHLVVCPECHKHSLRRVYMPTGVVFKGSGFYITDKRGKSSLSAPSSNGKSPVASNSDAPKTGASASEAKAGSKKSEAKASASAKNE
jgi:putative FmdB family regulatory protein